MKVALTALGCRLNEAELQRWAAGFQADGHQLTGSADDADLVVINTCAVTREAVKKSRQLIRRARRRNPEARLVLSGCYASLEPDIGDELAGIDLIVKNPEKEQLVDIVKQRLMPESLPAPTTKPAAALFARGRNRAFIKVQDGCRHKCTFCIVTLARGEERSRSIGDITNEINNLHTQGILEVILTGVHIGGYGNDLGTDLPNLLRAILATTDIPRIRLGSVEPWNLDERFFSLFDEHPRMMPHLHLPLQSGSDSVLRRMGRRCKTADFSKLVRRARQAAPDMNVTTDIIAGFPGETEADWQRTLDFCRLLGFSHIHVFPWSRRAGTRAATLPGQPAAETKKQRCRQLRLLAEQLKQDFMKRHARRRFPLLVENDTRVIDGRKMRVGYSPNYLRTAVPVADEAAVANAITTVQARRYDEAAGLLIAGGLDR